MRENGKNRKEIILPLGKLSDEEVLRWKKAKVAREYKKEGVSLKGLVIRSNYAYLDIAVALEIWRFGV